MAVTYGFYNAIDHDRQYNARHFSKIFDGVIEDGVYDNIGERFAVTPNTSNPNQLQVDIGTGRAWFNGTWTYNDAMITLKIDPADLVQYRIDAVVLGVDTRQGKNQRKNVIGIKKGTNAITQSAAQRPTMTHTTVNDYESYNQYPLAYILIRPGATSILATDITNAVGSSECPYASIIGNRDTRIVDLTTNGWVANNGVYIQRKTTDHDGIQLPYTVNSMPILTKHLAWDATSAAATNYNTAFNIVARGTARTGDGFVEFKTYSLPTTGISVALRGQ